MLEDISTSRIIHICDICDREVLTADLHTLYFQGIQEQLKCHAKCIEDFMKCKGDFTKLPEGRLKRAIFKSSGDIVIKETGITVRNKQAKYIIDGLRISHDEGHKRVQSMAIDYYGLPKPLSKMEYYSIDHNKQIVLMHKILSRLP